MTGLRRLLSGTPLPHHARVPDNVEVDVMIIEAQEWIADLEQPGH